MIKRLSVILAALGVAATPAHAGEVFAGAYIHDVDTPLSRSGVEDGTDLMLGWRGGRLGRSPLQPYVFGALNTSGETHYAAAGLSAKFGDRLFIRPGVGLAVHSGSARNFENPSNGEIDFGSRILFAPELGIGARLSDRVTLEASWVHMSHAQLFGRQNPGIDNFGFRVSLGL